MPLPVNVAPKSRRLSVLGMCLAAATLSVFAAMLHGSHADARLDEASGWTAWVVLDMVLVPVPLAALPIAFASLRLRGSAWRTALVDAVKIWLIAAMASLALAVFWI